MIPRRPYLWTSDYPWRRVWTGWDGVFRTIRPEPRHNGRVTPKKPKR